MNKLTIDTFDGLSALAREIANQTIIDENGDEVVIVESLLRKFATHNRANVNLHFLQIAYGKPEERVKVDRKSEDNVHIYLPVQDELPLDD